MKSTIVILLMLTIVLLSSCTQNNEQFAIRVIGDLLGKEIDKEQVTLISYKYLCTYN